MFFQVLRFYDYKPYGGECKTRKAAQRVLDRLCQERGEGMRDFYAVFALEKKS